MYSYKSYAEAYDKREGEGKYNYKYRHSMREMDRVLLSKLETSASEGLRLIDLGCETVTCSYKKHVSNS